MYDCGVTCPSFFPFFFPSFSFFLWKFPTAAQQYPQPPSLGDLFGHLEIIYLPVTCGSSGNGGNKDTAAQGKEKAGMVKQEKSMFNPFKRQEPFFFSGSERRIGVVCKEECCFKLD